MKMVKSFLYQNKYRMFIASFVTDGSSLYVSIVGNAHIPIVGMMQVTCVGDTCLWLEQQGNQYVKRLPFIKGSTYKSDNVAIFLQAYKLSENN